MSDGIIKLLLIDPDQIFRTGLKVVLERFPDLQVMAEAETDVEALQVLAKFGNTATSAAGTSTLEVYLVVLDIILDSSQPNQLLGLDLCSQIKNQYPNLPVFLLSSVQLPDQLVAARNAGVNGYCHKGIPVVELVAAMRQVATGRSYWDNITALSNEQQAPQITENDLENIENQTPIVPSLVAIVRDRLRLSGLQHIDVTLAEVTAQLQIPGLSVLEQAILAGHRRELIAARWLINQLLAAPRSRIERVRVTRKSQLRRVRNQDSVRRSEASELTSSANSIPASAIAQVETSSQVSFRTVQSAIFAATLEKIQFNLENLTREPLEIDIFREEKKRELLYIILRKIETTLDELRFSQIQPSQLLEMRSVILRDLWQAATIDFFGRYSILQVDQENLEIVKILLQDVAVVQTEILDRIPLVADLFSYLLFEIPLVIDNISYPVSSPEALARAEIILQNLLVQIANGVVQPLLNRFADVEGIKQSFYDRSLISSRDIERFRNNLSWKYRLRNYVDEPKAIFESRYELFVLANRGIAKVLIYAPRNQELKRLTGVRLAVTLALETRDAIAPRIRATVAFLGSGVVYVLTQVVGRAIGLIGRGILQGIGGSLPDSKNKKF